MYTFEIGEAWHLEYSAQSDSGMH